MGVIDLNARVTALENNAGSGGGGGDIDALEAAVTALENEVSPWTYAPKTTITTLTKGEPYADGGGCYYRVLGNLVQLHMAITGTTNSSVNTVYTLPAAVRPLYEVAVAGVAGTLNSSDYSLWTIGSDGVVKVRGTNAYVRLDCVYFIAPEAAPETASNT